MRHADGDPGVAHLLGQMCQPSPGTAQQRRQSPCPPPPTFRKKRPGVLVATVTDATSGPSSPSVAVGVDTRRAGSFTVPVTDSDLASNTTTMKCPYIVRTGKK